jgi:hypothetical protein
VEDALELRLPELLQLADLFASEATRSHLAAFGPEARRIVLALLLACDNGGGRTHRPRYSRIARTVGGSVTVAMIFSRTPQREHESKSSRNTRSMSSAHESLRAAA